MFLLYVWRSLCYSCYKTGDKSRMEKGPDCDYDKLFVKSCEKHFSILINVDLRCDM